MAHVTADRVRDTSTSTGTGTIVVSGTAPTSFRTFSAVLSTNDTFYYAIQHQTANEWEVGLGTYSSANTITRTTVYASSAGGSAVTFSSGTKDVFITLAAARTVQLTNTGIIELPASSTVGGVAIVTTTGSQTLTNKTLTNPTINGFTGDTSVVNIGSGQIYKDTSGNVGIGTSSPSYVLDVSSSGGISRFSKSGGASGYILIGGSSANFSYDASANYAWSTFATYVSAYTAGSERMRIDSSGNVIVGATSSAGSSQITAYGSSNGQIAVQNSTNWSRLLQNSGDLYIDNGVGGSAGNIIFRNSSSTVERMRIDSSGNIGIGTSSPTSLLDVRQSNPTRGIIASVVNTATSSQTGAQIRITQNGIEDWAIGQPAAVNAFSIWSGRNASSDGTERMRIDSSGNVGIGTSSPANKLDVSSGVISVLNGRAVGDYQLLAEGGYNGYSAAISFQSRTSVGGTLVEMARISADGEAAWNTTASTQDSYLRFLTTQDGASSERVRIASNGSFLVGCTDQTVGGGQAGIKTSTGSTPRVSIVTDSSTTATAFSIYSNGAGAYRFFVDPDGKVYATNTTISAISDQRWKENVRDLDVGLDAIMALKPRKFDWKEGKGKDIKNDRGFIAQELEQVFPDLIDEWKDPAPEGEDPYKAVRADLIPVLVKAIQELKAQNDELKARVAALETK